MFVTMYAMNKTLVGRNLNRGAIISFICAGIIYAITGIGRIPFWFIEAGMIMAFISIILLRKDKSIKNKKQMMVLNYVIVLIPVLIFIGVILFFMFLWYAFVHSDWQF